MTYGGEFTNGGEEFIVEKPNLTFAWKNYLSNSRYHAIINHVGSGQGTTGELTQEIESDGPGRYIYIRDHDSGSVWSAGFVPVNKEPEFFESRISPHRVEIVSQTDSIESCLSFTLSQNYPYEHWQIKLKNLADKKRRLSIYVARPIDQGTILANQSYYQNNIISRQNVADGSFDFLALNSTIDSFDGNQKSFLGRNGDFSSPQNVVDGKCARSFAQSDMAILVLQKNITLSKGSDCQLTIIHGQLTGENWSPNVKDNIQVVEKYLLEVVKSPDAISDVTHALHHHSHCPAIKTPDEAINRMINIWLPYQNKQQLNINSTFNTTHMERLIALLPCQSQLAATHIRLLSQQQMKDGAFSQNDNALGLGLGFAQLLLAYLRETADFELLNEPQNFYNGGEASIYEHLTRAVEYYLRHLSEHLLITSYDTDKNKSSTLHSLQLYEVLKEFLPLLEKYNEQTAIKRYEYYIDQIASAISKHCWKDSACREIGQSKLLIPEIQAQAILSSWLKDDKAEKLINKVHKELHTPYGYANSLFDTQDLLPGVKENGGISSKGNALLALAALSIGQADRALQIYNSITAPSSQSAFREASAEPYYVSDWIFGTHSGRFGQAITDHTTAAAAWWLRVFYEGICGVRPNHGGIKIDPCLPRDWRQVEISRTFRGAHYHIRIQNTLRQSRGVERILVDGVRQTGQVIQPFKSGNHYVEVVLG